MGTSRCGLRRLFGVGRDRVEADVGEEHDRRPQHDARQAVGHERRCGWRRRWAAASGSAPASPAGPKIRPPFVSPCRANLREAASPTTPGLRSVLGRFGLGLRREQSALIAAASLGREPAGLLQAARLLARPIRAGSWPPIACVSRCRRSFWPQVAFAASASWTSFRQVDRVSASGKTRCSVGNVGPVRRVARRPMPTAITNSTTTSLMITSMALVRALSRMPAPAPS